MAGIKKKLLLVVTICFSITALIGVLYYYQNRVTKENIIKSFKDNYSIFIRVQNYISQKNNGFHVSKNSLNDIRNMQNEASDIIPDIEFIINNLNYICIYRDEGGPALKGVIIFQRICGKEEQGIVYLKDSNVKSYGQITEHIGDGWYYYWIGNV